MRVLIIGGTRFIGKKLVQFLKDDGFDVFTFNRQHSNQNYTSKDIKGDVENILEYKEEILSLNFSIIIHCIAYTPKHANDIVELIGNTKVKLIVLSSCDSYQTFQDLNCQIDNGVFPITEKSMLSVKEYYWRRNSIQNDVRYNYDKNLVTKILFQGSKESNYKLIIFRLPLVYGPNDYQYHGRHGDIIYHLINKKDKIIFPCSVAGQILTYGYIDNIAKAIVFSIDKEICNGKIYNLADESSQTKRKWTNDFARITNNKLDVKTIPDEFYFNTNSASDASSIHFIILAQAFKQDTGFTPDISLEEAIYQTYQYAVLNPKVLENYVYNEKVNLYYKNYIKLKKISKFEI